MIQTRMRTLELCVVCVSVLVSCTSLVSCMRPPGCSRTPPRGVDCSTVDGECQTLYNNTAPYALIGQIPYPSPNTRSCYRTCFHQNTCKAFATGVNEQEIRLEESSDGGYSFQRVYSPTNRRGNYFKSTICRYHVKCPTGQILGYAVTTFDLEDREDCSDHEAVCLDWVDMKFSHDEQTRHCGGGDMSEAQMTGHNEVTLEFVTNRREQAEGFEITFRCYNDSIEEDDGEIQGGKPYNHWCTRPFISYLIIPKDFEHFRRLGRLYIVRRHWNLLFGEETILIVNFSGDIIWQIDGITHLYVKNYVTQKLTTYNSNDKSRVFRGYGYLAVYQDKAYYYQTEVKLKLQPSRTEAKVIVLIERALSAAIEKDPLDVEDSDDAVIEFWRTPSWKGRSRAFQNTWSSSTRRNFRNSYVAELALTYGNACNPILRAAACSYQAIVLGMDCSQ